MGISISGVGSGIDWRSMVDQLQQVEQQQLISPLNTQKSTLQGRLTAWQTLSEKLSSLKTAVEGLGEPSDFALFSASLTSSSSSVPAESLLSLTTSTEASKGQYTLAINKIAKGDQLESKAYTSQTADAGETGTLSINGKGTIELDGKSLAEIADGINALNTGSSATGVTASLLQVSTDEYRLLLSSDAVGKTAGTISLTGSSMDRSTYGYIALQSAQDAELKINDAITVMRSSNTITDVIPGVTLNLKKQDPATSISVNIDRDASGIQEKAQKFVDAYNGVMGFIDKQLSYDSTTKKTGGALYGDPVLKTIKHSIQASILDSGLSNIIETQSYSNNLSLDAESLKSALSTNFTDTVARFNSFSQSLSSQLEGFTDTLDGTVTMRQNSLQSSIKGLDKRIESTQDRIDRRMQMLTANFIAMDSALNQMQTQSSWLASQLNSLSG